MNESNVIQGLVAAGSFLAGLFVIFKYMINKTMIMAEDSHRTIQILSEKHTQSMSGLVKDSVRAQEKVANAVDSLNSTLLTQVNNTPTKSDVELLKTHFDVRHDKIEAKIDTIISKHRKGKS